MSQRLPWFATVRGRAGYSTGPALWYLTGGWAAARIESNAVYSQLPRGPDVAGNSRETRQGWTVGGGLEAQLFGNWTAKIEYLYMDFGRVQSGLFLRPGLGPFFPGTWDFAHDNIRNHVVRMGLNYRFGDPVYGASNAHAAIYKAPVAGAPSTAWSGFYIGGNAGILLANNATEATNSFTIFGIANSRFDNFRLGPWAGFAGAQAGYNRQAQPNWMIGLEADLQAASGPNATACFLGCAAPPFASTYTVKQRLSWFGTARARAGYAEGANLFYLTGGLAYGGISSELDVKGTDLGGVTGGVSSSHTKVGWTVGGGVETQLAANLTGKIEYLYMDLGTVTTTAVLTGPLVTNASFGISSRIQEHVARVELNYQFNNAVVAKY